MKLYPSFIPPDGIGERQPDNWSGVEARKYFEWLVHCTDERTSFLIEYFGEHFSDNPEALLSRLGEKVSQAFRSPPFVERQADPSLSNAGFALAADMGLLVARFLLAEREMDTRWVLARAKRSIDHNQPVLQGSSKLSFNPVRVSITEAAYATKNKEPVEANCWLKMYLSAKGRL